MEAYASGFMQWLARRGVYVGLAYGSVLWIAGIYFLGGGEGTGLPLFLAAGPFAVVGWMPPLYWISFIAAVVGPPVVWAGMYWLAMTAPSGRWHSVAFLFLIVMHYLAFAMIASEQGENPSKHGSVSYMIERCGWILVGSYLAIYLAGQLLLWLVYVEALRAERVIGEKAPDKR